VGQDEGATTVLVGHGREAPDVAQTYRRADRREDEGSASGEGAAVRAPGRAGRWGLGRYAQGSPPRECCGAAAGGNHREVGDKRWGGEGQGGAADGFCAGSDRWWGPPSGSRRGEGCSRRHECPEPRGRRGLRAALPCDVTAPAAGSDTPGGAGSQVPRGP